MIGTIVVVSALSPSKRFRAAQARHLLPLGSSTGRRGFALVPDQKQPLPAAIVDATRYFYYQRQGIALDAAHAGVYTRGVGHPQDANAPFASGVNPPRDVSQGWYDAGDYGKYVNAGAVAVSKLIWAYQL
jgi:hypothetical protein